MTTKNWIALVLFKFKIHEVFIFKLYRGIQNMLDMLFSTNTTKGRWNHIWLIYPLFHYSDFPIVLWALRTLVSKTRQTKQIHRFSTLIVNYIFVSKAFYELTWIDDREMVYLQMFSTDFFEKYSFNRRLRECTIGESRISRGSAFHKLHVFPIWDAIASYFNYSDYQLFVNVVILHDV